MERNIYITTNLACNLNCVYCYEHNKNNDSFDLEQAKNTIKKYLSVRTEEGTVINFHGGEPFISFKKIKNLCEWAWLQNFPEQFKFFATSNGTLIHEEIKEWLHHNRNKFVVGLSLDGNREMHNTNRSNSFDLIDLDFFVNSWPNQTVKMTISPKTIHSLADGIIFIHEKGFKKLSANLAEMTDWSESSLLNVYRRELEKLSKYYLTHPDIERCSLFSVYFAGLMHKEVRKWCGVGTDMEVIDVDGNKYPCHLFFEEVCGKEKSKQSHKIDFTNPLEYISEHCRECRLLPICPTCYGSNYIERGHIGARDLSLCEFQKIRFSEVAKFEYNRIVNDTIDVSQLSDKEKYERMRILEGIEYLSSVLTLN